LKIYPQIAQKTQIENLCNLRNLRIKQIVASGERRGVRRRAACATPSQVEVVILLHFNLEHEIAAFTSRNRANVDSDVGDLGIGGDSW
jgi:hypothetical protein